MKTGFQKFKHKELQTKPLVMIFTLKPNKHEIYSLRKYCLGHFFFNF